MIFSYWKEPNFRPQYHSLQGHMNEKLHGYAYWKETICSVVYKVT